MTSPQRKPPSAMHGPDEECPSCYECPGCRGGDGSTPRRSHLLERPGVVMLVCSDCNGDAILCPWYDATASAASPTGGTDA